MWEHTLQQPWPRESLSTEFTLAGQSVRSDVHLECAQGDVHLLTVLAAERFLHLTRTVKFLMLGKTALSGIALAAVDTLVSIGLLGKLSALGRTLVIRVILGVLTASARVIGTLATGRRRDQLVHREVLTPINAVRRQTGTTGGW